MQNDKIILPLDIYYEHLTKINGVEFTSREVDVICCILNRRATSIPAFLSIGQRAVETYNRNIRHKAGGLSGREQIIDFIEKSGKFSLIKNEYYLSLRLRILFEEKLKEVSKKLDIKSSTCLLVYEKSQKYQYSLIPYLKEHLRRVGFEIKTHLSEGSSFFAQTHGTPNLKQINHVLYILPENFDHLRLAQINPSHASHIIFVSQQDISKENVYKNLNSINLGEEKSYYFSFFEILRKLSPHSNLQSIVEDFKQQYKLINKPYKIETVQADLDVIKESPSQKAIRNFLKYKTKYLVLGCITALSSLITGFFISKEGNEKKPFTIHFTTKHSDPSSIRSDLILPNRKTLLNRPELMKQINSTFKGPGGIQTIAFVGIGGSGKTTTARYYARQHEANVVWEINSETKASLMKSFENLAQSLSKTTEDKKIFRELQEIRHCAEREKELIEFVKEKLRLHSNWLLIYDNVEDFTDIQTYFPKDINTWGEGKIILTTQNHNIQNNRQVDGIILMGELSPNQKLKLFMQIMNQGGNYILNAGQNKDLLEFLKQLPPFPLDISVAAYYLKTTNIPYEKYLERLEQLDKHFTSVQENLLKDAGEYTKTRYGIITLALNELINDHEDFKDLLLFISLLDSQNIPRDLLDSYKEKTIVDNFVYHLKKSSFIMREASIPSVGPTLSIHRSTQAITLAYLTQRLNLEKNNSSTEVIGKTLKNYMRNIIDKEDVIRMKAIVNHYKSFLSHGILRTISSLELSSQIGCAYYFLGDYQQSQKQLENYFLYANLNNTEDAAQVSQNLEVLGSVYRELGYYQKAVDYLNKSLQAYQTNFPKEQNKAANILTSLGNAYRNLGDVTTSKQLLHNSISIYKKSHTKNYLGLARALGYLGNIYYILGDFTRSRDLFKESLLIHKKYCSKDSMDCARVLIYLGKTYIKLGNLHKAKIFIEHGLGIYREYYRSSHINLSWALLHLGNVYQALGEHKKALSTLEKITAFYKKYYGEQHIDTAWASMFLGEIYCSLGNYKKSIHVLQKSRIVHEQVFGANHIDTGAVLRELGRAHLLAGQLELAEKIISKSIKILSSHNHSDLYQCLELLAALYIKKSMECLKLNKKPQAQNFKSQATKYLNNALEIVRTRFPEDSAHKIRIRNKIKTLEKG